MPKSEKSQHWFLLSLFALATVLLALIIAPFAGAFFAAAVLAGALSSWHRWLTVRLGNRRKLSASLVTTGALLCVAAPLLITGALASEEVTRAADWVVETVGEDGVEGLTTALPDSLRKPTLRLIEKIPAQFDLGHFLSPPSPTLPKDFAPPKTADPVAINDILPKLEGAVGFARTVALWAFDFTLQLSVAFIALFFFLSQGHLLVAYLIKLAPLGESQTRGIIDRLGQVNRAIFTSTIVTAMLQTFVALIGYLIVGLPSIALILVVTFVSALIPLIGAATIVTIAGALLWISGDVGHGIFLTAWGLLAVSMTDNVAKPLLASKDTHMSGSLLFFAMICGVAVFGPMGVVAGPLIVAFFQVVAEALEAHVAVPNSQNAGPSRRTL